LDRRKRLLTRPIKRTIYSVVCFAFSLPLILTQNKPHCKFPLIGDVMCSGESVSINPNTEISQRMQERFEFYVIALAFTLLGLSIQTASFGESVLSDSFELLGWLFLFISGLAGLSRLEWVPVMYNYHVEIQNHQSNIERLRQAQQVGQNKVVVVDDERGNVPIEEAIQAQENIIAQLQPETQKVEKWNSWKYKIHKWSFIVGLLFLLLSRSYAPVVDVLGKVRSVNI